MLGEHPHREAVAVVVVADTVRPAGDRAGLVDQRAHQIRLPDGVDPLQQREDALETGTGVDRRFRQRRPTAVGGLVELHEHEVPELHEPVAGRIPERPAVGTERGATIDVDLAAGPARAGVARLPEVVLVTEALDAVHRDADDLVPDRLGFVVGLVHGDPESISVETPASRHRVGGDEIPAPWDRRFLEVVTEAEIAEHLEEDEVPLGTSDVIEVVVLAAGTCALLRAHRTQVGRLFIADEVRLERQHPSDVEQHRRVVRDQTGRWNDRVILGREVLAEGVAQLIGVHRGGHIPGEPIDAASLLDRE